MTIQKTVEKMYEYMNGWNSEHYYRNVLNIQELLCMDDTEEKLRRLRRRQKSLCLLRSDFVAELLIENLDHETREAFKALGVVVQGKIDVLEKAIRKLSDYLVSQAMTVWLEGVMASLAEEENLASKELPGILED